MDKIRRFAVMAAAMTAWTTIGSGNIAVAQSDQPAPAAKAGVAGDIERGRYMVVTGHCNNCHTAGYTGKQGNLPEKDWLLGNPVGYRIQAGTSYASNLRLTVQNFTEEQWVRYAQAARPRPPMPWWGLRDTMEQDLRAMYQFIKHLGPAGKPAPDFVPPDKEPAPPYETRQLVR
jgi:mono/diheme cytochrome c family protein